MVHYQAAVPPWPLWASHEHSEPCLCLLHLMNHEGSGASEISCVTVLLSVTIASVLVHKFVCSYLDYVGILLSHVPAVSLSPLSFVPCKLNQKQQNFLKSTNVQQNSHSLQTAYSNSPNHSTIYNSQQRWCHDQWLWVFYLFVRKECKLVCLLTDTCFSLLITLFCSPADAVSPHCMKPSKHQEWSKFNQTHTIISNISETSFMPLLALLSIASPLVVKLTC